jgi:geranylgeranyl pyrophosphate synthase
MARSTSSNRANSTRGAESADSVEAAWSADRLAIDQALERACDSFADLLGPPLADAVRYSLLGGGKRLRGLLFLAAYRTAGGVADASELAAAIEVVHAYSLVHDDLPCMDDDDMRRGRPTLHRARGLRLATVAGVAMVPFAAVAASRAARRLALSAAACERVVKLLMEASGASGMIGGQLLDLEGEGRPLTLEELERVHRAKTGALVRTSVVLGGLAAGAGDRQLDALDRFGEAVGLAFQIADDVLDVTATTERLGKPAGRDLDLRKSTYPALLGVAGATERANVLVAQGCSALREAGLLSTELDTLARFVVERQS